MTHSKDSQSRVRDTLKFLIEKGPGRTERELAHAIYGEKGYQQLVNQDCGLLVGSGKVEVRENSEGVMTYWPKA